MFLYGFHRLNKLDIHLLLDHLKTNICFNKYFPLGFIWNLRVFWAVILPSSSIRWCWKAVKFLSENVSKITIKNFKLHFAHRNWSKSNFRLYTIDNILNNFNVPLYFTDELSCAEISFIFKTRGGFSTMIKIAYPIWRIINLWNYSRFTHFI